MPLTDIEKQIATRVLTRFLTEKKPTARKPLSTEFKDPHALNHLVECSLLYANTNRNSFLPKALAFHYWADEKAVLLAKKSVEAVVRALQDLFTDASEDYPQFTPDQIETRARQIDEEVTPDVIRLGLYLVQEFGVLGGWTPVDTEPAEFRCVAAIEFKSVGTNEHILTAHADTLWDEYIQGHLARLEPPPAQSTESPTAENNILLSALRVFCSDADMEEVLTNPHDVPARKLRLSDEFELHIAWFLALFGFSTVILGGYERLVSTKTNAERGSLDILASHQGRKLLLAIACTMNAPKQEDFLNLRNVREFVVRQAGFAGTEVRVIPVLFNATMGGPSCNTDGKVCVPIVDADKTREFLQAISQGQDGAFLDFLSDPDDLPVTLGNGLSRRLRGRFF